MAKEMLIKPSLCTGCSSCSLACSLHNLGVYNPSQSYIKILKKEFEGVFEISFSSRCKGCLLCARTCPSGALRVVDLVESN